MVVMMSNYGCHIWSIYKWPITSICSQRLVPNEDNLSFQYDKLHLLGGENSICEIKVTTSAKLERHITSRHLILLLNKQVNDQSRTEGGHMVGNGPLSIFKRLVLMTHPEQKPLGLRSSNRG